MAKYKYLSPLIQTGLLIRGGLFSSPKYLPGIVGKPVRVKIIEKAKDD
jgi:hypothetical protein